MVSPLLASSPNYVEITALLATALAARLLALPALWRASTQACVAVALLVSILVYACVDRGQLFAYFGCVQPRRRIFWLYALVAGAAAAALVVAILHAKHTPLGQTAPAILLYGVSIGPIIEEILFRGAALSVIYVTTRSIEGPSRLAARNRDCPLFPAFRGCSYDNDGNSVACILCNGHVVRAPAVALQFNRGRSSHARYIPRRDCLRNAASLARSTLACRSVMCSISPSDSSFDAISSCGYTPQGSYRYASGDHNDSQCTSEALHSECAATFGASK